MLVSAFYTADASFFIPMAMPNFGQIPSFQGVVTTLGSRHLRFKTETASTFIHSRELPARLLLAVRHGGSVACTSQSTFILTSRMQTCCRIVDPRRSVHAGDCGISARFMHNLSDPFRKPLPQTSGPSRSLRRSDGAAVAGARPVEREPRTPTPGGQKLVAALNSIGPRKFACNF